MRATSKLLALALTAALQPAIAAPAPVELDFDDIVLADTPGGDGYLKLENRYAAGKGIEFTDDAWGVIASGVACKGNSKFIPLSGCAALAMTGGSFTLKLSEGFITGSSLYYSAVVGAGVEIALYENETSTQAITSVSGLREAECTDDTSGAKFCNWDLLTLNFIGTARYMVVTGATESLMMDNFSFKLAGATTPPGRLPEPASLVLAFSALGALGWARKRAAR